MKLRCNKLWKLLINKGMNKTQLQTMAKLGRGGNVQTDELVRICETLVCDIADIVEVVEDEGA